MVWLKGFRKYNFKEFYDNKEDINYQGNCIIFSKSLIEEKILIEIINF